MTTEFDDDDDVLGQPGIGHNSSMTTAEQLKAFVERIERLEEDKRAIAADIGEIYKEAKSEGYDVKTIRKVVSIRRKNARDRQEEEALLETYLSALGML